MSILNWEKDHRFPEAKFIPALIALIGHDTRPQPKTMGEDLVVWRTLRGWTQKEFAGRIGVDPTTLARWERDERLPWGIGLAKLKRIMD